MSQYAKLVNHGRLYALVAPDRGRDESAQLLCFALVDRSIIWPEAAEKALQRTDLDGKTLDALASIGKDIAAGDAPDPVMLSYIEERIRRLEEQAAGTSAHA